MKANSLAYAYQKHHGQVRRTGESYIHHPVSVMERLEDLGVKGKILDVALLHDICEDTSVSFEDVRRMFGKEIGSMVYFLTKNDKEDFEHTIEGHELRLKLYLEKLKEGIREYPGVMLVKMSDQLDNLETIAIFDLAKRARIVQEIKQFFLPLYQSCLSSLPKHYVKAAKLLLEELGVMIPRVETAIQEDAYELKKYKGITHKMVRTFKHCLSLGNQLKVHIRLVFLQQK